MEDRRLTHTRHTGRQIARTLAQIRDNLTQLDQRLGEVIAYINERKEHCTVMEYRALVALQVQMTEKIERMRRARSEDEAAQAQAELSVVVEATLRYLEEHWDDI